MTIHRNLLTFGLLGLLLLLLPGLAGAQQPAAHSGVGVVTALQGQATVAHQTRSEPSPLHFEDDVFFRDSISTKERSTVRLLLGGKGVLTVREQSEVTLDETVAPDGTRRSVLSVLAGKIAATIAHSLMAPGEEVEIKTPDAVAAIRGTVIIAEYIPPQKGAAAQPPVLLASSAPGPFLAQAGGAAGGQSNFFVLSGNVVITPQGQPPVTLGPLQAVSVNATPGGVRAGSVQNITPAQLAQVVQGLNTGRPLTGEPAGIAEAQTQIASLLASTLIPSRSAPPQPAPTPQPANTVAPIVPGENSSECIGPSSVCAPSASPPSVPPPVTQPVTQPAPLPPPPPVSANVLPAGPILSLNNFGLSMAGPPVAEFGSGSPNAILPLDISFAQGSVYDPLTPNLVTSPLLPVTGDSVSHSGPLVTLNNFSLFGFDVITGSGLGTPLVSVTGTSLTNTDGPLFSLTGNSFLTGGSLLSLDGGGSATLAGILSMTGDGDTTFSEAEFNLGDTVNVQSGSSLTATGPLFALSGGSFFDSFSGDNLLSVGGMLTVTGNGSLLNAASSSLVTGGSLLFSSGGTITLKGSGPPVQLNNSNLFIGSFSSLNQGSLISLNTGATLMGSGPVLDATNGSTIEIGGEGVGGPIFALRGGSQVTWTGGPLIRLNNSSLLVAGGFGDSDGAGNRVGISAVPGDSALLLDATNSRVEFDISTIPKAGPTDTDVTTFSAPPGVPLIRLTGSTYVALNLDSPLIPHIGGTSTFDGLLLVSSLSSINVGGNLWDVCCGAQLTTTETAPLIQLSGSQITTNKNLLNVSGDLITPVPTSVTLSGPLVSADGTFNVFNHFLRIADGGSLISTSSDPLISLGEATFTGGVGAGTNTGGSFLRMFSGIDQPGSSLSLHGGFLSAAASFFDTTDSSFINVRDGASLSTSGTGAAFLSLGGSTVVANENIFRFGPDGTDALGNPGSQAPVTVSLSGPLLSSNDVRYQAVSGGFLGVRDQTTFTGAGSGPLISLLGFNSDNSFVSTPSGTFLFLAADPDVTPPVLTLSNPNGSLLSVTNTNITAGNPSVNDKTFLFVGDGATLASAGTGPLTTFTNSSLSSAGNFLTIRRSGAGTSMVNLSGALLSASDSSFATFNSVTEGGCCSFLFVGEGGKLQGSGPDALVQSSNSQFVNIGGSFVNVTPTANLADSTPAPSSISLSGPLMDDTGSGFIIAGSLLRVADGSTFSSTTTLPLMKFSGSTVEAGSLLFLRGAATDPLTGLGTQEVLKTGGPIIELSGATPATGTTINLTGTGNAIRLDTALLNASAPVVNLINSTLNTSAAGDGTTGAMHLFQSSVTSNGPVFGLNNSILQVNNGPLLSLTGGSQMTVNGDLASLINGSKVTVLNGPLVFVDGGPTATKSTLTINGALVNFASGTGNQVIINNSIPATRVDMSSNVPIPVHEAGAGSLVSITNPSVVKNPANGTVSVTCTTGCVGPNPASAIQVVGGGRVFVKP